MLRDLAKTYPLLLTDALSAFVNSTATQSQEHIRPLHQYVASRLVIEGGFSPEDITPRPPFVATRRGGGVRLDVDPDAATSREATVLGAVKTKRVDVVVAKAALGPVMIVSVKGTTGAFRNLTNRMEEALGDAANIHERYPGIVYGFIHVLRGNREGAGVKQNDVAIDRLGNVVPSIQRYHEVLDAMTGRAHIRNDTARYESIALMIAQPSDGGGPRSPRHFRPSQADCTTPASSQMSTLLTIAGFPSLPRLCRKRSGSVGNRTLGHSGART